MNRSEDWLAQAQRDLEKAKIDLQYEYWEWACFTSQQAAEKGVKGFLLTRSKAVIGHSITAMLASLQEEFADLSELIPYAQLLDAYYIPTRYPNGFAYGKPADYFNRQKAQEAIHAATAILQWCNNHLPRP